MTFKTALAHWASALRRQTLVVYFVARDPGTPWWIRLLALLVAGYALSPLDLIPDFIPIVGYLDELLLLPLGIALILRLAPPPVVAAAKARAAITTGRRSSTAAACVIVAIWLLSLSLFGWWLSAQIPDRSSGG